MHKKDKFKINKSELHVRKRSKTDEEEYGRPRQEEVRKTILRRTKSHLVLVVSPSNGHTAQLVHYQPTRISKVQKT